MKTDVMVEAYIEAIYFTDTGDTDQPPADAELSPETRHEAWSACHRLMLACSGDIDLSEFDYAQIGHDLWLTRNGHGSGFWDRPEIYGKENARILTLMAKAMGEHESYFRDYV